MSDMINKARISMVPSISAIDLVFSNCVDRSGLWWAIDKLGFSAPCVVTVLHPVSYDLHSKTRTADCSLETCQIQVLLRGRVPRKIPLADGRLSTIRR